MWKLVFGSLLVSAYKDVQNASISDLEHELEKMRDRISTSKSTGAQALLDDVSYLGKVVEKIEGWVLGADGPDGPGAGAAAPAKSQRSTPIVRSHDPATRETASGAPADGVAPSGKLSALEVRSESREKTRLELDSDGIQGWDGMQYDQDKRQQMANAIETQAAPNGSESRASETLGGATSTDKTGVPASFVDFGSESGINVTALSGNSAESEINVTALTSLSKEEQDQVSSMKDKLEAESAFWSRMNETQRRIKEREAGVLQMLKEVGTMFQTLQKQRRHKAGIAHSKGPNPPNGSGIVFTSLIDLSSSDGEAQMDKERVRRVVKDVQDMKSRLNLMKQSLENEAAIWKGLGGVNKTHGGWTRVLQAEERLEQERNLLTTLKDIGAMFETAPLNKRDADALQSRLGAFISGSAVGANATEQPNISATHKTV